MSVPTFEELDRELRDIMQHMLFLDFNSIWARVDTKSKEYKEKYEELNKKLELVQAQIFRLYSPTREQMLEDLGASAAGLEHAPLDWITKIWELDTGRTNKNFLIIEGKKGTLLTNKDGEWVEE